MNEDAVITIRKEKLTKFFKERFSIVSYILLAILLWINVSIRSLPMQIRGASGKPGLWDISRDHWTLGPDLDPFVFLRYAKIIVEEGSLPAIDFMRNVPLGFDTAIETQLLPYSIAYFHIFLTYFSDVSVEYSAVIFPVVFSVFTAIAFFLLVQKIFQEKGPYFSRITALVATAFLISIPSFLTRTIAGIPEKESMGFGIMFFAFYLFLSAWKAKKTKNAVILGVLSGLATAFMGLVWGGVVFIYASLAVATFIAFILKKVQLKQFLAYSSWLIVSIATWIPLTARMTLESFITFSTTGSSVIVLTFLLVHFSLFRTPLKNTTFMQNNSLKKIPRELFSIIVSVIIITILGAIFISPTILFSLVESAFSQLTEPYVSRIAFTVAENRQPFFSDWQNSFGPTNFSFGGVSFNTPPLFFWLFFIGTLLLFYEMVKKLKGYERFVLFSSYLLFLLAIIFSRKSSQSILNGSSPTSIAMYMGGFLILLLGGLYVYYHRYKSQSLRDLRKISYSYIFVFSLVFIGVVGARGAIRLVMLLGTIATIPLAYLTVATVNNAYSLRKKKGEVLTLVSVVFAIAILIFAPYTLFYNYQVSKATAANHIPSQYAQQWQSAMGWVRENTAQDAVFGHWWDYGYWVQSMGERATMLDGGNGISYWNYLMGRHGLTAQNETEALELLYNHNVTHFLIDSTDIGKYSAYSSIGSDENYDRYSFIGTFLLDERQIVEKSNETLFVYPGGVALDEDLVIIQDGKEILLPKQRTGVGAIIVPVQDKTEINGFAQPYVVLFYQGKQYEVNLRHLYVAGEHVDYGSGIDAAAYLMPRFTENQGSVNGIGAALFLSPRNMRALWVHLYLLGEGENFTLVHSEPSAIVKTLKQGGAQIDEFVYFRGIQGPIKIWEVSYTGEEKNNPEYLARQYPERIASRRDATL